MRRLGSGFIMLALLLSTGLVADDTARFEFKVAGMSCGHCAESATEALRKIEGVRSAKVDFATKKATVVADTRVNRRMITKALGSLGFEARFAGEEALPPLTESERKNLDIAVASRGERLDLQKHLAPGKFTIFDFWAEWCGPCHLLTPKLEHLVDKSDGRIALRTIDLVKWDSPVAAQATEELQLPGLPYVRIYGPDGKFLGAVVGNHIDKIEAVIEKAAR